MIETQPKVPLLFTDTETFSEVDIKTAGTVKYAESTELLLAGFSLNGEYSYYDYTEHGSFPESVLKHIREGGLVVAHNALFDFLILRKVVPFLKLEQMVDSMAIAGIYGLPLGLDKMAKALDLPVTKHTKGSSLIRKFCIPRKPTKNNDSTRNHPQDFPEDWAEFRDVYLRDDVRIVEMAVNKLGIPTEREMLHWIDTQKINMQGIPVDVKTTKYIMGKLDKLVDDESTKFIRLTGLFPTQRDKTLAWVRAEGVHLPNLQAATVAEAIASEGTPEHVKNALLARANTTHMSFKKFPVILAACMEDNTIKGCLMHHVAITGRFGGRLLQPQNLTKGNIDGEEAVERIQAGEFDVELVKSAVRPMIYHEDGFTIVDYSSIEARIVQWVAKDEDALQVFKDGDDPYIWMATKIYDVPYDEVTKKQRFTGKQAILGLGYQMSAKKFIMMVESYGETISKAEAALAVKVYRETHNMLVRFWKTIEKAAVMALERPGTVIQGNSRVSFVSEGNFLYMNMPSGRRLAYYKPEIRPGNYGDNITYYSVNEKSQYVRTATYGGKLTENLVQGLARDILVEAVHRLLEQGYKVVTHIHDEVVIQGTYDVEEISSIMCELPEWAEGMPIEAEGFNSSRFKKD